jgi:hypothetical protein
VWMRAGLTKPKLLLAALGGGESSEDIAAQHHIAEQLEMEQVLRQCTSTSERPITQIGLVVDLRGLSLVPSKVALRLIKRTINLDNTYFPERLGYMFIINAPGQELYFVSSVLLILNTLLGIFEPVWKIVSKVMDENTASKIRVCGDDREAFLRLLLEKIDENQIPKEYGGTATFRVPFRPMSWPHFNDLLDECGKGYPPGIEQGWDEASKQFYYINHNNGTTSFTEPVMQSEVPMVSNGVVPDNGVLSGPPQ